MLSKIIEKTPTLIQFIDIFCIKLDYSDLDVLEILELSDDIELNGLQHAILLQKEPDGYKIIHGRKRVAAYRLLNNCQNCQWLFIPATICKVG